MGFLGPVTGFKAQLLVKQLNGITPQELGDILRELEPALSDEQFRAFVDATKVGMDRRYPSTKHIGANT